MAQSTELSAPAAKSRRVTSKQAEKQVKKYRARADRYKDDLEATQRLLTDVERQVHNGMLSGHLEDIKALMRLVRAHVKREYEAPWESVAIAIGGLIYLLSPVDLIPDAIPVAGLVDDASVIALVVVCVSTELLKFREWEVRQLAA
jgi:uncharacterized membrane protein YkvA (DUF1232 family)